MARGINKVILVGNLGSKPDMRKMPNGHWVANISIATSSVWKDKQTNEFVERTEWHRVVFFNRLAEIVNQHLDKGAKIYVEGSLRTRKWEDKTGIERYTTEIIANEMQMLDRVGGSDNNWTNHQSKSTEQPPPLENSAVGLEDHFDDDIPF